MIDKFDVDSKFSSLDPADADLQTAILYNLVLEPNYRKMGLGRQLINTMEQSVKDEGKTKMVLYVKSDNPDAKRLYEKLGYCMTGSVGTASDGQTPQIRMIKTL
jgi:ribosomal protein S18 acetylase RimI-like enzyme